MHSVITDIGLLATVSSPELELVTLCDSSPIISH